jgi:hypothetical protein
VWFTRDCHYVKITLNYPYVSSLLPTTALYIFISIFAAQKPTMHDFDHCTGNLDELCEWAVGPFPVDFFLIVKTVLGWLNSPLQNLIVKGNLYDFYSRCDGHVTLLISNRLLQNPITKGCLALSAKNLIGVATHAATLRRWRGGARACHHAQMEGWHPVVSLHEGGGGSSDLGSLRPMAACRRRGGTWLCHHV